LFIFIIINMSGASQPVSGYNLYGLKDQTGSNLAFYPHLRNNLQALSIKCNENKSCIGFTSDGMLKKALYDRNEYNPSQKSALFVKNSLIKVTHPTGVLPPMHKPTVRPPGVLPPVMHKPTGRPTGVVPPMMPVHKPTGVLPPKNSGIIPGKLIVPAPKPIGTIPGKGTGALPPMGLAQKGNNSLPPKPIITISSKPLAVLPGTSKPLGLVPVKGTGVVSVKPTLPIAVPSKIGTIIKQ
jgi:hypothetical protein